MIAETASAPRGQTIAWMTMLDAAAVLGSLALACMTPFVGLAVVAALTLPRNVGLLTVAIAWVLNQAIGYGVLGYPTDTMTILRGVAILVCAVAAFGIGRLGRTRGGGSIALGRAVAAFLVAFVAYELVMYGSAVLLGGTENFTPAIVWLIGSNDALWSAGLLGLHQLATAGAPKLFGTRPALRLA